MIACCIAAIGGKAYADEPAQKVDVYHFYATNTARLSDNKASSVGAVEKGLRCDYYDNMTVRPEGTHPPAPPRWETFTKR